MNNSGLTIASTFGAALATLAVAPDLLADVIDLSFSPGTVAYGATQNIDIGGLDGPVELIQWNDSFGKSMLGWGAMAEMAIATFGQSLTYSNSTLTFWSGLGAGDGFSASGTGVWYVAFKSFGGDVGWFSLDLGGLGGDITYLDGQFGTEGEALQVGVHVPAPAGLALLALGAAGIRSTRRKREAM